MWLFIVLVVATQTVLCNEITADQNKTCTRSAISVKTHEYDKDTILIGDHKAAIQEINKAFEAKPQKNPFPSWGKVASDFKLKLETMVVRKGDADPITVKRLTGINEDGAVRATAEYSTSDGARNRYTVLEPGRFDDMVNSCKEARMHKMFGSYGRNVNTRNGPSVGFTNMNQNKMQGSQWKQYPKYSPQSYGMPNAYYQQYKAAGSNYGNPYPNTMKQPNNNHAQMGLQGQPNNNPPRNAGYGNPGYRYPNPPNYGNYNPYPPRQGSPNYSGNQYYGQNPYPNNNYNHNNYNQVNSNGYNPRYQFNRNPNVQNPSQLNTNARITVKNTGNQQSFKPNQFSSYSNVRNPPVPNNPSRNANQFNSKPNAQGQMLPNNPSHVGKQMRSSPVSGISEANRQPSAKSGSQLPNAEAGKSSVPQSSKMKTRDFPIYGGNPQWASYLNRNAVHRR